MNLNMVLSWKSTWYFNKKKNRHSFHNSETANKTVKQTEQHTQICIYIEMLLNIKDIKPLSLYAITFLSKNQFPTKLYRKILLDLMVVDGCIVEPKPPRDMIIMIMC